MEAGDIFDLVLNPEKGKEQVIVERIFPDKIRLSYFKKPKLKWYFELSENQLNELIEKSK